MKSIKTTLIVLTTLFYLTGFSQKEECYFAKCFPSSQRDPVEPRYTICGKSDDYVTTVDEFKKCNKKLTPMEKSMVILHFHITVLQLTENGKDSIFTHFVNKGNIFRRKTIRGIDKLISDKKYNCELFIHSVLVTNKECNCMWKPQFMVIKLKQTL